MTSDRYNSIVATLDGLLTDPADDLPTAKNKMEAVHGHPIAQGTEAHWLEYDGTRCAVVTANKALKNKRYLLYFHGGAFIAGDGDGFLFYAEMLSRQLNARVVMVDYRLAPAHPFPATLDDCCNAYQGMLNEGIPASSITLIGDSCGGGLVLTTLLKLTASGVELPSCGISLCGWFDVASNSGQKDLLYHQAYCHQRGKDYAGTNDLKNPLVSPVYADLQGLPPLLLQAGEIDPTSEHARIVYKNARSAGTTVTLDIAKGMLHGFQGFANLGVPESIDALHRAEIFLQKWNTPC